MLLWLIIFAKATADTKMLCRATSSLSALPGSRALTSCACQPLLLLQSIQLTLLARRFFPHIYYAEALEKVGAASPYCKYDDQILQLIVSALYLSATVTSVVAASFSRKTGRKARCACCCILCCACLHACQHACRYACQHV